MAFDFIGAQLAQQQAKDLWRERQVLAPDSARFVIHQGQKYLNFCSNDYLAMAADPQVIAATQQALEQYGVGSGGSSLISGYSAAHQQLEQQLCQWLGFEGCLLFNSGFAANSAVIHSLIDENNRFIVQDKLSHASLISSGMQVKGQMKRFIHNDTTSLQQRLNGCDGDTLVVSEGVFSMDGDCAPISDIARLAKNHGAWLMIDDAHGIGVYGQQGQGTVEPQDVDIHMVTFGKAIGTSGAAIGGSRELIEYLIQKCKHYIYSTAMPAALAVATSKSIELIQSDTGQQKREKLTDLIAYFKQRAKEIGLTNQSNSAIQPLIIGSEQQALLLSKQLKNKGIWLNAIRPPTVPPNTSRLRVTLNSAHKKQDIDSLFDTLESLI